MDVWVASGRRRAGPGSQSRHVPIRLCARPSQRACARQADATQYGPDDHPQRWTPGVRPRNAWRAQNCERNGAIGDASYVFRCHASRKHRRPAHS